MRPIGAWGLGWMTGAIFAAAALVVLEEGRAETIASMLFACAAAAAFGVPTWIASRRHGSHRPVVQALVWAAIFAAAAIVLSRHYLGETALASPGDLNINTTETIRAREASFRRWGVAPEVVSSWIFTLTVAAVACFSSGVLSALVATGWAAAGAIRAAAFGLVTTIAILAGIALLPMGTYLGAMIVADGLPAAVRPLTLPLAFVAVGLLAGCATGAAIEYARANLLLGHGPHSR